METGIFRKVKVPGRKRALRLRRNHAAGKEMAQRMPYELTNTNATCGYCGHQLDGRVYFCPACAKPYRSVEIGLPTPAPPYEDIETRLRTKAPDVWTVFFVFLSAMIVTGWIGMAIWGTEDHEAVMMLVDFALFVTTAVFLFRYWKEVRPLLVAPGFLRPAAWIGLAALAPLLALNYGYHSFLVSLLDIEMDDYNAFFTSSWGPIIFICILPAVVEEIAFRGIIQHRFEKVVGPWVAIAAASVLFSAAHFTVLSAPYLAVTGALLGWMKWKTGSIYPSILAHFIHNYIVVTWFDI